MDAPVPLPRLAGPVLLLALGLGLLAGPGAAEAAGPRIRNYVCYYGSELGFEAWGRFDLAILDGLNHPPLEKKDGRPLLLGYVTVGEAHPHGPVWPQVQGQPWVIKENPAWGSLVVDVRSPEWRGLLLDTVIPSVLAKGFDGLFLDTFDSALALAEGDGAAAFAGTDQALVSLVREIKARWPDRLLAVNRGLPLLPALAPSLDLVMVEDLSSLYDFDLKDYRKVPAADQAVLLDQVARGLEANPGLTVLTLDYAPPGRKDLVRAAIARSRKHGFVPYVSVPELDRIFRHTLGR